MDHTRLVAWMLVSFMGCLVTESRSWSMTASASFRSALVRACHRRHERSLAHAGCDLLSSPSSPDAPARGCGLWPASLAGAC